MKKLYMAADIDARSGIGRMSLAMAKCAKKQGCEFVVKDFKAFTGFGPEKFVHCDPVYAAHRSVKKGAVLMTYHETDQIAKEYAEGLNRYRAIIVTSEWVKEAFIRSKVTVPIHVVNLGIDQTIYKPDYSKLPQLCIFAAAAQEIPGMKRKNISFLLHAFSYAFPIEQDVVLRVKVLENSSAMTLASSKIQEVRKFLKEEDMLRYYREATAFVSPAHSEGFGLHGLEAMACGKPMISAFYSGEKQYFKPGENGYEVKHALEGANDIYYKVGRWARLDFFSLVEQLRYVYENRTSAFLMGLKAAKSVQGFTEEKMTFDVLKILKHYNCLC